jgi:hypothetical protein
LIYATKYRINISRLLCLAWLKRYVDCELCVSAIDARGQELFTCTRVKKSGLETHCRKCIPGFKYFSKETLLPLDQALSTWRPLLAHDLSDKAITKKVDQ